MNEHSHVRIESSAFASESVHLIELTGREQIARLFEFHAQVASSDPAGLDVDAVIGAPAILVFERGGVETRRLGGIIAGIRDSMHEETGRMVYDLWFAPRAFRLGLVETYEIFMDLSVPDIVKKKLERAGLQEDQDYELRLTATYPPREFVVQYQETDLSFVSRLLEHVGVSFFFEHKEGVDVLVLSDANSGFAPAVGGKEAPFRTRGERQGVFAIESHTRMTPAQYVVKDYNYRTPQLALQASAPNDKGDGGFVMEYGAHFKNPDEGAQVAKIRAEELAASRTIFEGKSDRQGFSAGAMVVVENHPRGDLEMLLTEVHHHAATSALGTGKESARDYENTFKAIPFKTPYRPARTTQKPRIHGVITGVIDAAAKGPYAELDGDGRYRVRFLFDAGDAAEGQASRLCRMAQPHGGGGFGMHFPLRSGVEVILTFVEGDPDRPIILGVVPNPQTPSPVTGGNGTRNIIRTGGGNEINIDDTAGAERIKMTSPFGNSTFQLGAKNCPEDGVVTCTDDHVTTNSKQSVNFFSATTNLFADIVNVKSATDMTYYCTPNINTLAVVSAVVKAAGDVADMAKAAFIEHDEQWLTSAGELADKEDAHAREEKKKTAEAQAKADEDTKDARAERDKKQAELDAKRRERDEKQKDIDAINAQIDAKEKERASKNAELHAKESAKAAQVADDASRSGLFGLNPPTSTAALDAEIKALTGQIRQLEKEISDLKASRGPLEAEANALDTEIGALEREIAALDEQIANAQTTVAASEAAGAGYERTAEAIRREADARKATLDDSAKKEISEWVDKYLPTAGGALLSEASAIIGFAAQKMADINVAQVVASANRAAAQGRNRRFVSPIVGPSNFTGGATNGAALVSERATVVGSALEVTVSGGRSAAVLTNGSLALKGCYTELTGDWELSLTSSKVVDVQSGKDIRVHTKQGNISVNAASEAVLSSKQRMDITGGGVFLTSTENLKVLVEKGPTWVTAKEGNMTLETKAGNLALQAHEKKSAVTLTDASAAVVHKEWGITIKGDRMDIGKHARKNEDLWLSDNTISMKRGGGLMTVADENVTLKGGSTKLTLASGGFFVKGKRIDLG